MASTRCGCPARSRSAAGFGFTDGLARSRTCRAAASRPPSTSPSRWRAPRSLPPSPVPSTATTPEPPAAKGRSVSTSVQLVDDLVGPYLVDLGTDDQRTRWLPGLAQRRHGGRARRRRQDG